MNYLKILQTTTVLMLLASIAGCTHHRGLAVTHSPNPTAIHQAKTAEAPAFPYVWYYRTEVSNATDRPIQVTKFEGWFYLDAKWTPANITHRTLTSDDFSTWFAQGDRITNGWIQPRGKAACDPNWHGATSPVPPRCKWTFEGIDASGKAYHAEAEIESIPVEK